MPASSCRSNSAAANTGCSLQRMLRFLDHFTADEFESATSFIWSPGADRASGSVRFLHPQEAAPHATPGPKGSQTDRLRAATWGKGPQPAESRYHANSAHLTAKTADRLI